MHIEFFQLRHYLLGVKLQLDLSHSELISELVKEKWICWNDDVPIGHENPTWDYRYKLPVITGPVIKSLADFIQSEETKEKALDALYSFGSTFQGLWSINRQQMREWTCWHCDFMLDKPGFYLEPHNDYRRLVAAGMIYFANKNDVDISTTFYSDRQLNNPITMTTDYGDGWLAVNDYSNWHTGHNRSNYDRYSVLLGLTIKTPEEYERL